MARTELHAGSIPAWRTMPYDHTVERQNRVIGPAIRFDQHREVVATFWQELLVVQDVITVASDRRDAGGNSPVYENRIRRVAEPIDGQSASCSDSV
jgi:hypothetical protein